MIVVSVAPWCGECPYEAPNPILVPTIGLSERPKRVSRFRNISIFMLASASCYLLLVNVLTNYKCPYEHADMTLRHQVNQTGALIWYGVQ